MRLGRHLPSLRDETVFRTYPGVETPGYLQESLRDSFFGSSMSNARAFALFPLVV
jgi:hypothetical protein